MADEHHCCGSHSHCDESKNESHQEETVETSLNEKHFRSTHDDEEVHDESKTVSQLFDLAWSKQNHLQSSSIDTTTDDYASELLHTIRLLESIEKRLQSLELFSDNEQIEELSTNNIRFLLLPAFLAWLHQTKRSKPSQRLVNVQHACDYYGKFLQTTRNYGLHQFSIPKPPTNNECEQTEIMSSRDVDMMRMAQDRASKIQGHLKRREEEEKMRIFEETMKNDATDDEARRNFYLSKIRSWINTALDDLKYLHDELRVLLQRQTIEPNCDLLQASTKRPLGPTSRPLKPIVLTRDQLQARVFSQGYPSVPTMTIDEFYQSLAQRGLAPTPEQAKANNSGPKFPTAADAEKEEVAKERLIEKDDGEMLAYLRTHDEFKDEHRRGEGNRHNRS